MTEEKLSFPVLNNPYGPDTWVKIEVENNIMTYTSFNEGEKHSWFGEYSNIEAAKWMADVLYKYIDRCANS